MHATDAKTQKIEPDPNFLWRTKVSEAVCKRDWHNMRSYLFFNVRKFQTQCAMTLTVSMMSCIIINSCRNQLVLIGSGSWTYVVIISEVLHAKEVFAEVMHFCMILYFSGFWMWCRNRLSEWASSSPHSCFCIIIISRYEDGAGLSTLFLLFFHIGRWFVTSELTAAGAH